MFARIEVAVRPDFLDSEAQGALRRIELVYPSLRKKIRWARWIDIYWVDIPAAREELISAISEVCWDKVLQWIFTGNLMPSAAGKIGSLQDLMQMSPTRPGKFWGLERRFRSGVTDNVGRTLLEGFEIVLQKDMESARAASGALLLLEGSELDEDSLALIAREVFCNELVQTWTLLNEDDLKKNDRFHQERVKFDLPRVNLAGSRAPEGVEKISLEGLSAEALEDLSRKQLWALSRPEMQAVRDYYRQPEVQTQRRGVGLSDPTDVELEVIAQTWSEHCKHKIFNAKISYREEGLSDIPKEIDGLFRNTIAGTTADLSKPWLLSVFDDNAGICSFDEEDAFCIKVETHNSPSALDPYGGALTGIVGVNRDILGCGLGAKPIFNTNVFCVAPPDYSTPLPDRILHPRRILDGIRRGVEHGGNKSGIPTVNGALVFDDRYLGKPLVYCGTGGLMPRESAGRACQLKEIHPGDRVCMVGGRIGKDGIHGATFSSLAFDEFSPSSAVQLGDPITQKRMSDFLLEARDLGLYRAITDNGAGGLSSSVGELARLSGKAEGAEGRGGASIELTLAKTKYPGLKPYELVISESQERMTVAVPPEKWSEFAALAGRRKVEVSDLGSFTNTGKFEIFYAGKLVASLDLDFLHKGVPQLEILAEWKDPPVHVSEAQHTREELHQSFQEGGAKALLELLSRPNIASKEWLIRQYDHEVQGSSVIKPLHTLATGTPNVWSGPNDAGVLKPKAHSDAGLAVGCGINPKFSDIDPFLMAQSAVDEAVRNVLCVGGEYGNPTSVLALVDNFCWPDVLEDPYKAACLVRACYGMRDAALHLSAPFVSGKDSMKNDFKGWSNGKPVAISVPPTLLITAVARVPDIKAARSADFKAAGDGIYLLGPADFGLLGSEYYQMSCQKWNKLSGFGGPLRVGTPHWETARRLYSWLGGAQGKLHARLKSVHDVSDGGVLVAVAESLLARGLGASIYVPADLNPWEFMFGEGFHSFVATLSPEESATVESEWQKAEIPFRRLGTVENQDRLEVFFGETPVLSVGLKQIRSAWLKEGYWE